MKMPYEPPKSKGPKIAYKGLFVVLGSCTLFIVFLSLAGFLGLLSILIAFVIGFVLGLAHQYTEDKESEETDLNWAMTSSTFEDQHEFCCEYQPELGTVTVATLPDTHSV